MSSWRTTDELTIQDADPADAFAVASVHVRSWQVAYRNLLPDAYLDSLRPEDRAVKYDFGSTTEGKPHTLVAIKKDLIVGFVTTTASRDPELQEWGELAALYVDPDLWGLGIGTALIASARSRLLHSGFKDVYLWVLQGNARAEQFYRADGWIRDGNKRTEVVWGITVDEVRYLRHL